MGSQLSAPHFLAGAANERLQVIELYGKLPLFFEANRGQTDRRVKFLSRSAAHTLFLTSTEAVLVLTTPEHPRSGKGLSPRPVKLEKPGKSSRTVLRMAFLGKNSDARVSGQAELPGKANYFIGNDPAKWRTNVPTYAKVQYRDLYPGIDLIYYGNQRQLEYDFVVRPGADPARIVIGIEGADTVKVDAHGDLLMHTAAGTIRQRKPAIYQEIDGRRRDIAGGYVLRATHHIGFAVGSYDRSRPLIFDPVVLSYSTYLGGVGSLDTDSGYGIAVDGSGNAYVTGRTGSPNFPATLGAFQTTYRSTSGGYNAFVTKITPAGKGSSDLVYSTYLGGSGSDVGTGVAVDAAGNAYVTGSTSSTNFPTTPGAFAQTSGGFYGTFLTKITPAGKGSSDLVYSTYLGGDDGAAIALDASGNVYVTGTISSTNFPTTAGAFQTSWGGGYNAFVTKITPAGKGSSDLVYSTYLGGSGTFGIGIAVDATGNAYVTGITSAPQGASPPFPTTPGAFQTSSSNPGAYKAFVTKITPAGQGSKDLVYSTYLGGSGDDYGNGIAVDSAGNAYVTGLTNSTDFPVKGAYRATLAGGYNAFVTKLTPAGQGSADLVYSTYLGGSGSDYGYGIAVDTAGNAYMTGFTTSSNFPTMNAFQPCPGAPTASPPCPSPPSSFIQDVFVTKLNPSASGSSSLVYSTYLGGGDDGGYGIAVDGSGNAYVTGLAGPGSTNFPTTPGAYQTSGGGPFVAKLATGKPDPRLIVPQWYQAGIPNATDPNGETYCPTCNPQQFNFWGPLQYDHDDSKTIGKVGCALTALTMLVNFWKKNPLSPSQSNPNPGIPPADWINNKPLNQSMPNGWTGLFDPNSPGDIMWSDFGKQFSDNQQVRVYMKCPKGTTGCSNNTFSVIPDGALPVQTIGKYKLYTQDAANQTLINVLRNGIPVVLPILGTLHGNLVDRHFVVVTGWDSQRGKFLINDPGADNDLSKNPVTTLDQVSSTPYAQGDGITPTTVVQSLQSINGWKVYTRIDKSLGIADPNTPQALGIYTDAPVELILTDPLGRQTGFNPITNTFFQDIPTSDYSTTVYSDEPNFSFVQPPFNALDTANQMAGQYTLTVIGTGSGSFTIDVIASDAAGNWILQTYSGTTVPGVSSQFTFQGTAITFAAFGANLAISPSHRAFGLDGTFTLGTGGTISPTTQPVTIQVGDFLVTIPAGSFERTPQGTFIYGGVIQGVLLAAALTPTGGNGYAFAIGGAGAPNLPIANPVDVRLAIGNNGGDTSVNATFLQ